MKQYRKYIIGICCMLLVASTLTACKSENVEAENQESNSDVNWNKAADKYGEDEVEK